MVTKMFPSRCRLQNIFSVLLYVKAMISYTSEKMLLYASFKFNLVIAVKIKHTLHCYDLIHKQKDAHAHQF